MSRGPLLPHGTQRQYGLQHLIARSSEAGLCWAKEYQGPMCTSIRRGLGQALVLLRRHEFAEGYQLLTESGERLQALEESASVPVQRILSREHLSIWAYYYYLLEDSDRAEELLASAQMAVRSAIEMQPCLVPQAIAFQEYCFQRARISRSCRRWEEMRRLLEVAKDMIYDQVPLCVLSNGNAIFFSTLDAYFHALRGLEEGEAAYVRELTDPDRRRRKLDRFIQNLYTIPGVVIPF